MQKVKIIMDNGKSYEDNCNLSSLENFIKLLKGKESHFLPSGKVAIYTSHISSIEVID